MTSLTDQLRQPRREETALSGAASALLAQLATAVFTAAVTLYLVRALGPEQYGALALVLSVTSLALLMADMAVGQSTARFVAAAPDAGTRREALVGGLRVKVLLGAAAAVLLAVAAGPVAALYGDAGMTTPLRAAALTVAAESLVLFWLTSFQALRRLSSTVVLNVVESGAEAVLVFSLVAAGLGVTGAVLGRGLGYAVGATLGLWLVVRVVGRLEVRSGTSAERDVVRYALPLFASSSAYTLYQQSDLQLVGALLGRAAAGTFAAPLKLVALVGYPGAAVASAVAPRMAGRLPDAALLSGALRCLLLYQAAVVVPLVVWAEPICELVLGEQYGDSAVVLAGLAPFVFLNGISMLVSTTVNYLGEARRRIPIVLLALAVNVVLCAVLLPTTGVVGATVAVSASYALYVPLHVRICRERLDLPLRPLALTAARSLLAAALAGLVLSRFGTHDLTLAGALTGASLGAGVYLTTLVASGEVTAADARHVAAAVSRLRHRRAQGLHGACAGAVPTPADAVPAEPLPVPAVTSPAAVTVGVPPPCGGGPTR